MNIERVKTYGEFAKVVDISSRVSKEVIESDYTETKIVKTDDLIAMIQTIDGADVVVGVMGDKLDFSYKANGFLLGGLIATGGYILYDKVLRKTKVVKNIKKRFSKEEVKA